MHIGAEAKLYTAEYNLAVPLDALETVQKGKIAIIKHCDDGSTQIEMPEKGAEFEVYLKKSGSYTKAKESERDILICDENGFTSKDAVYGLIRLPITFNPYTYVCNNPLNLIDPSGEFFEGIFGTVAGGARALWDGVGGLVTGKGTSGFKSGWNKGKADGNAAGAKWDSFLSVSRHFHHSFRYIFVKLVPQFLEQSIPVLPP